ncbi:hypothetical protein LTS18_003374 [Coniosporium uncinatum]|uniref:Uncharacterized protein n=1 Tax=Coniosporium uncinatum TaxID=93489 RepID=A0ACC3DTF6_9PEZI|nr:hypothetical protein LTS18_003374 [Coniosporium uncinatum]
MATSTALVSAAPTTPATQTEPTRAPIDLPPTAGTWRHPRLNEITRRQNASTFSDQNFLMIIYNAVALFSSFAIPTVIMTAIQSVGLPLPNYSPYPEYALNAVRLVLLLNILSAVRPLAKPKDEIEDIPLTPSQRALLGLPPSSAPATPGSQYITPPRFSRSATPRSSAGAGSPATGSPLAGRGQSPSGSPLLQKTLRGSGNKERSRSDLRRLSYGSPGQSPLGLTMGLGNSTLELIGRESSRSPTPGTPTPATGNGRGASVGLNNKWLYERGKGSPGSFRERGSPGLSLYS